LTRGVPLCGTGRRATVGPSPNAACQGLAETPNAVIKQVMGLRQFGLRGLEKVRTEWWWACTAFNLKQLIAAVGRLRAGGRVSPT
jgi:hypothetical protein